MEHPIPEKVIKWAHLPVWCITRELYFYLEVDMEKFDHHGQQMIQCPCGFEEFIVQERRVLNVETKRKV
jgi:hypothetical protein